MQLSKNITIESAQIDVLVIDNDLARARISLYGGHVLSFQPKHDNRERLWVSPNAILDGTRPIRGGIPICWPWFGDHPGQRNLSAHGYARTQKWHLVNCVDDDRGTVVTLKPETTSGPGADGELDLQLTISVSKALSLQLTTKNVGVSDIEFTAALHSYFKITDIAQTQLVGLAGEYLDKCQGYQRKTTPKEYYFQAETDNVHLDPAKHLTIIAPDFSTSIESLGHDSVVVWNPWAEKSAAMADMPDDGYRFMLCVEAAITQGKTLIAGEQHTLSQAIE